MYTYFRGISYVHPSFLIYIAVDPSSPTKHRGMVEDVHEGAVIVGVDDVDVSVDLPQIVDGRLELLVVVLGERVVALEAAPLVAVGVAQGGEEGEVAR
jgi:hypothetical protein